MKIFLLIIIFGIAFFLQMIIPLPFVLLGILLLSIICKESWIFPAAFLSGIFVDLLTFHSLGLTSVFFTVLLGLVFLYQRKFEIQTVPFIFVVSFISTFFYFFLFTGTIAIIQIILSSLLAAGVFWLVANFGTGKRKSYQLSR